MHSGSSESEELYGHAESEDLNACPFIEDSLPNKPLQLHRAMHLPSGSARLRPILGHQAEDPWSQPGVMDMGREEARPSTMGGHVHAIRRV